MTAKNGRYSGPEQQVKQDKWRPDVQRKEELPACLPQWRVM
jgi:hypothetical protein